MTLLPFNEPLPDNYFADGQKLTNRGKGRVEKRRDSLVDLLNDLREKSVFGGYQVDPDNANKFASIPDAYEAADEELPPGVGVLIIASVGIKHNVGTWSPDGSRSIYILTAAKSHIVSGSPGSVTVQYTEIEGTFNLVANTESERAKLTLYGIDAVSAAIFNVNSNWMFVYQNAVFQGSINRTHGADGALVEFVDATNNGNSLKIIDSDDAPVGEGSIKINGGFFGFLVAAGSEWAIGANVTIFLQGGVRINLIGFGGSIFDCQSKADIEIQMNEVIFEIVSVVIPSNLFINHANATIKWNNVRFCKDSGLAFNLGGSTGTHSGAPIDIGDTPAIDPVIGTVWMDQGLGDTLIWDGTYWGNGTIFRKDLLVNVDTAAVSHSSGWTVPAGAGVINTSANALKDLTAGGGATLYGISDGSDGDKFAESSALVTNSKASAKQASINVGGGDTIYVHSMTSTGTEGGTLAGSNDKDVRVVVYFTMPKTLPNV